jgi:hypothetical protein
MTPPGPPKAVGGVGEERRRAPPDFNKSKRKGQFMQSGVAWQYALPTATSSA